SVQVANSDWQEVRLSLACFADLGADMSAIQTGLLMAANGPASIGLSDIRIASDTDAARNCGS
ncbi:MAG: putative glycoside hydrolase, partial [Pseudomonadota bacterium]